MAAKARPSPRIPSVQITANAPSASSSAKIEGASATTKVMMAGRTSSNSDRTMMTETMTAQSENSAMRRAQMARRDIGSSAAE